MVTAQVQSDSTTNKGARLGELLRAARRRKGLTLQELANAAGCAKSYLSQLETGFRPAAGANHDLLARLERELGLSNGELVFAAQWEATPGPVRRELARVEAGRKAAAEQLRELLLAARVGASGGGGLDELHRSGRLRRLIDRIAGEETSAVAVARGSGITTRGLETMARAVEVPLINSVAAGYPCDFTDLGYPARVADEYVRVPDVQDADAFAARVVGDSMMPEYREGDIVVFSPARQLKDGMDCFVRIEPDHQTTFKGVFFEGRCRGDEVTRCQGGDRKKKEGEEPMGVNGHASASPRHLGALTARHLPVEEPCGEFIRLQPLNPKYPAMTLPRERIAGLYAAVSVTRMV